MLDESAEVDERTLQSAEQQNKWCHPRMYPQMAKTPMVGDVNHFIPGRANASGHSGKHIGCPNCSEDVPFVSVMKALSCALASLLRNLTVFSCTCVLRVFSFHTRFAYAGSFLRAGKSSQTRAYACLLAPLDPIWTPTPQTRVG